MAHSLLTDWPETVTYLSQSSLLLQDCLIFQFEASWTEDCGVIFQALYDELTIYVESNGESVSSPGIETTCEQEIAHKAQTRHPGWPWGGRR